MSETIAPEAPDILGDVQQAIAALEAHPDPAVREHLSALLAGIDAVHRTALTHLVGAIGGMGGEAFLNRLVADPAIRILLMSYDLLAVDRRLLAEEALDFARGHLHAHGVDVELVEVVGGVVYARLHGLERGDIPEAGVRRDLEAALREGFIGFQELVLKDRETSASSFVTLGSRRANRPVYQDAFAPGELVPGQFRAITLGAESVLVLNVDGDFYAIPNRCGESPLPLEFSTLHGPVLRCSWHGCRYDVRSGARLEGESAEPAVRLRVLPVAVENDVVRVAVGVEPLIAR